MESLTDEELQSFEDYAKKSLSEPDGTQSQWADYTLRLIAEVRDRRSIWQMPNRGWEAI